MRERWSGLQAGKGALQSAGATAQPSPFALGQAGPPHVSAQERAGAAAAREKQPFTILTTARAAPF